MTNIVIDARGMSPPEPLVQAMTALDRLAGDAELTLFIHRRPYALFPVLSSGGYRWEESEATDGGYKYRIARR